MLYDKEFLRKLDNTKNKTIFARITALTFQENPIETIEGRVTQGSVNIDGSSAVRRTCSLTMVAQDVKYNDYYWGLNTKFKLEIGVENNIDKTYPKIIWFKQGIYLITSFNTSHSTNNFSISIQGKDKMSLLNGEIGGSLESSVDFGTIEEEDQNGIWTIRKIPIPEIIRNAVHVYGGEPYHNIIINDLDTYGLELLEYRYDKDMYLYRLKTSPVYQNVLLDGSKACKVKVGEEIIETTLEQLEPTQLEMLVNPLTSSTTPADIEFEDGNTYIVTKIRYGDTAGYRKTDLTYAGDLIANVGESLTSVLDKIKNMLVEFEYFYDEDGRFIFQKKQSFISTMWGPSSENGEFAVKESLAIASTHAYTFNGSELITSFNNNPNLLNLRNDYSIWGERTGISGAQIPIHLRYAIDIKPTYYKQITVEEGNEEVNEYNEKYSTTLPFQASPKEFTTAEWDWREIIYQMALDYYRYNMLSDFELRLAEANKDYYPSGRTGYESYYSDMQGFWRQLYYPELMNDLEEAKLKVTTTSKQLDDLKVLVYGTPNPNSDRNIGGIENYRADIINKLDNLKTDEANNSLSLFYTNYPDYKFFDDDGVLIQDAGLALPYLNDLYYRKVDEIDVLTSELTILENKRDDLKLKSTDEYYIEGELKYWNKSVYEFPESLNFWFDFLDGSAEKDASDLSQFNVKNIGARPKSINDTAVKSIYFRETPNILFINNITEADNIGGYKYIQVANLDSMFSISAQGKSAKARLDELIYQHGYCIESSTINAIPIYYLQPNTRVYIHDEESGIDGDYIVSKITLPLTYNGTMSITATKAAENII